MFNEEFEFEDNYKKYAMDLPEGVTLDQAILESFRISKTSYEFEQRILYFDKEKKAAKEIKLLLFELQKLKIAPMIDEAILNFEKAEEIANKKILKQII
jgi:hypothetical protein